MCTNEVHKHYNDVTVAKRDLRISKEMSLVSDCFWAKFPDILCCGMLKCAPESYQSGELKELVDRAMLS